MSSPIELFRGNLSRVLDLGALHDALRTQVTEGLDLSDILRAELVFAVSCLDHYVHEVTHVGMLETYAGRRQPSQAYSRFQVSIGGVSRAFDDLENDDWFDDEIRRRHQWQTFEHPDKIAEAIRLVSDIALWDAVATRLNVPPDDIKNQLRLIVDRRNKIAHEADLDPIYPGNRWPIDSKQVGDSVQFIQRVVEAIDGSLYP